MRTPSGSNRVKHKLPMAFWAILTGALLNRVGTFVAPFLAIYLTRERGLGLWQTSLALSMFSVGAALAGPIGGWCADLFGRRRTMVGALLCGGSAMIGLGQVRDPIAIGAGVFLVSFLGDMYRPALQATVAELVPPDDRLRAFGLLHWTVNLGYGLGLLIAGILADTSYALLFVGDGVTTIAFACMLWRAVPETLARSAADTEERQRGFLRTFFEPYLDGPFVLFLVATVLMAMVLLQFQFALPVDMTRNGLSSANFGALLMINTVVILLLQPIAGSVLGNVDRSYVIAGSALLIGAGYGLYALGETPPWYAAGIMIWTVGEIGALPASAALVAHRSPSAARGRYQGAQGLAFGLGACLSPILSGIALEAMSRTAYWSACLGVGCLSGLGFAILSRSLAQVRERRGASVSMDACTKGTSSA